MALCWLQWCRFLLVEILFCALGVSPPITFLCMNKMGHLFGTPYPDTIGTSPTTKKHPGWIKSTFVLSPLIHNDEDMLSGASGITNTNANTGIIIPLLSQAISGPPKWPKSAQIHFLNFTELIRITVMNLLSNCYAPSSVLSTCHIVTYLILKTQ